MKKITYPGSFLVIVFIAFLLILSGPANSQTEAYKDLPQYLYPDFAQSKVKMKAGKDLSLMLNYNLITERMVFFQKDKPYDMLNQSSVDTIYLNGSKFIPYEKVFLEVFPGSNVTFFIEHRGKIQEPGKPAAYGGTSQVSSSTYYNRIEMSGQIFNMKLLNDITVRYDPLYWVRVNNNMASFAGEKQLLKIFPGKEDAIKQFIRKNKLKFDKTEDVLKIWEFCNGLMK
jgi:hypothetical protein